PRSTMCHLSPVRMVHVRVVLRLFSADTAPSVLYTLSLHDALPILVLRQVLAAGRGGQQPRPDRAAGVDLRVDQHRQPGPVRQRLDRKSTRLNSSHSQISYAVFCLKKKKRSQNSSNTDARHTLQLAT